ncbi:unnamed protein product [Chrysoparadoxa australica]
MFLISRSKAYARSLVWRSLARAFTTPQLEQSRAGSDQSSLSSHAAYPASTTGPLDPQERTGLKRGRGASRPALGWTNSRDQRPKWRAQRDLMREIQRLGKARRWREVIPMMIRAQERGLELNISVYNAAIAVMNRNNQWREAYKLTAVMHPDSKKRATTAIHILEALQAHGSPCLQPDLHTYSCLITLSGIAWKLPHALELLAMLKESELQPSQVIYNSLIRACGETNSPDMALEFFHEMLQEGIRPCKVTYGSLLHAYGRQGGAAKAQQLFDGMQQHGLSPNMVHYNSLIMAYGVADLASKAVAVYHDLVATGFVPSSHTYTNLLHACSAPSGSWELAVQFFNEIDKPTLTHYNALIDACGKDGQIELAHKKLKEMKRKGVQPCVVSYSAVIACYVKAGCMKEAKEVLKDMQADGISPNYVTYNTLMEPVVAACDWKEARRMYLELLSFGEWTHWSSVKYDYLDLHHCNKGLALAAVRYVLKEMLREGQWLSLT